MKTLFKIIALSLSFLTLHAIEPIPIPSIVLANDTLNPIILQTLNIQSKITGNIAQTTYEMGFYNPNERILEGDLKLPLLENQAVVGYALEIEGQYRDAVIVPKVKAKESYENTIRQQIDPAILEKTLGNHYKLRLYPIPANRSFSYNINPIM